MKKLILLAAFPFLFSCTNTNDSKEKSTNPKADSSAVTKEVKVADWNAFYNNFQTAVKNKDTAALRTMCDAKSFDPEFLTNMINHIIQADYVYNTIINTPADKVVDNPNTHDQEELKKYTKLKAVECAEKIGNETGAISNYYFTEINGEYKLVYNLQAG